jgi:SAM-dependent methyltransferase
MSTIDQPEFWDPHYKYDQAPWDLGAPAPALKEWLRLHPDAHGRVAVLGCGRGHDAVALAEHGFNVVAVDFAPSALAELTARVEKRLLPMTFEQRDIFSLLPDYAEAFDYVFEHTCFCAIDPMNRQNYGSLGHDLLKPGGSLVGVFYTHGVGGGPPFDVRPIEIQRLFESRFDIRALGPTMHSVSERQGKEHFGEFCKAAKTEETP